LKSEPSKDPRGKPPRAPHSRMNQNKSDVVGDSTGLGRDGKGFIDSGFESAEVAAVTEIEDNTEKEMEGQIGEEKEEDDNDEEDEEDGVDEDGSDEDDCSDDQDCDEDHCPASDGPIRQEQQTAASQKASSTNSPAHRANKFSVVDSCFEVDVPQSAPCVESFVPVWRSSTYDAKRGNVNPLYRRRSRTRSASLDVPGAPLAYGAEGGAVGKINDVGFGLVVEGLAVQSHVPGSPLPPPVPPLSGRGLSRNSSLPMRSIKDSVIAPLRESCRSPQNEFGPVRALKVFDVIGRSGKPSLMQTSDIHWAPESIVPRPAKIPNKSALRPLLVSRFKATFEGSANENSTSCRAPSDSLMELDTLLRN